MIRRFYTNDVSPTDKSRRQTRLSVIEGAAAPGGRRLILIRRDNVEHLLMIGGRSDVVIEPNIVRATAQPRKATLPASETFPSTAALNEASGWPMPEPAPRARPQRVPPAEEPATWPAEPELPAPPRPPRRQPRPADPLAGLAAELGRAREPRIPMPGDLGAAGPREPREPPRQRDNARERDGAREMTAEREPVRERETTREREPAREPPRIREPQPPPAAAEAPFDADADRNLADMAQRLEAALRRPGKPGEPRPADSAPRAAPANAESRSPSPARGPAPAEAKPAGVLYDSLEKEWANLLGRPAESASRVKVRHADLGQPPPAAAAPPARQRSLADSWEKEMASARTTFENSLPSENDVHTGRSVDVGAFAPETATAGSVVLVQLILYPSGQRRRALNEARLADPDAVRRGAVTLSVDIEVGQLVCVVLDATGLPIEDSVQSFVWRNEIRSCQYRVTLPRGIANTTYQLRGRVLLESVPVGTLCFTLRTVGHEVKTLANPKMLGDSARRYQYAFLSYATADRVEVLKRAQALKAIRIGFFQDLLHLEPGERWQRRLFEEIDKCDLFLLFWSSSAARSDWVLKEVQYALARSKSSSDESPEITPIVLEGPPIPPPPPELHEIHFNDALRYVIATEELG